MLWPIQNVQNGDECTRDFLFGIGEDKQRSARLTAYFHTPQYYFIQVLSPSFVLTVFSFLNINSNLLFGLLFIAPFPSGVWEIPSDVAIKKFNSLASEVIFQQNLTSYWWTCFACVHRLTSSGRIFDTSWIYNQYVLCSILLIFCLFESHLIGSFYLVLEWFRCAMQLILISVSMGPFGSAVAVAFQSAFSCRNTSKWCFFIF